MNKNFLMTAALGLTLVLGACQKDENKSNQTPANPAVNGGGDTSAGGADGGGQAAQRPTYGIDQNNSVYLDGVWVSQCRPSHYLWNVPGVGAQPSRFTREVVVFGKDQNNSNTIRYVIEDSSEYDYDCSSEPNFSRVRLDLRGVYSVLRTIRAEGGLIQISITHTSCSGGNFCPPGSNLSSIGVFPNDIRFLRVVNSANGFDLIFGSQGGPRQINQDLTRVFSLQNPNY